MTRALRYTLIAGVVIMTISLFLLASASYNSNFFDQNYPFLLGLNALVAICLLAVIVYMLARFYRHYRRKRFGSRLMGRLVLLFAAMGILPGIVIYTVSVQFVSRSIESWFDVRVESALDAGVKLGRTALDTALIDLKAKAQHMAISLADYSSASRVTELSRLREDNQVDDALLVTANGLVLATATNDLAQLVSNLPTSSMLQQARFASGFSVIEGGAEIDNLDGEKRKADPLRFRVVVVIPDAVNRVGLKGREEHFLQLIQPVSHELAANAESLQVAYSEYQTRRLARTGLRKIYIVTLTLTLLLSIFAAIAGAFVIASRLARPLLLLAQGTKAVAEGDFSPRPTIASPDELGLLTKSFNMMTSQLAEARAAAEASRFELEEAKEYLESVLENMSAGVMVLDEAFCLVSINESVERILEQDIGDQIGKPLSAIAGLADFALAVAKGFSQQSAKSAARGNAPESQQWQQQIEIERRQVALEEERTVTLLARGSRLHVGSSIGYIIVFDNISDVISAQRLVAWGEVARRLAHEIKNPLTPIQLSAERLHMKLKGKVPEEEVDVLDKSIGTIVNQVQSMKRMVDDFRDYAQTPPAALEPLDLNKLIEELVHLYTGGESDATIRASLADDLPTVMGDETQLRQVVHNLIQNAQDAVSMAGEHAVTPEIDVKTETVHYQDANGQSRIAVRLSVVDNGPGFSPAVLARAFEPYVTSKSHGTGLGLAMVKKIIDDHEGRISVENRTDTHGAKVHVLLLKLA